jgi:hypothetical protein
MTRRETTLPHGGQPTFVAPGVDPARAASVAAYSAGIAARRGGALPKAEMPLQPPSRPPIPYLTGGPSQGQAGGQTMADFARLERGIAAAPAAPVQGSIIEEAPQLSSKPPPRATATSLGLNTTDLLAARAYDDPAFIKGPGCEFAVNQPGLAAKYGVLRNGEFIPPQRLGGASENRALSQKTLEDLKALKELSERQAAPDTEDEASRKAVVEGMGASARVGNAPGDNSVRAPTDAERAETLKRAIDQMDAFEFNQWRQMSMRQILHSEEERQVIEKRLQPLDIGILIRDGVIRQVIPIIPNKYEITLQSYDGQVDLALKRLVMSESKSVEVGEQYHLDKYSFMTLAVGLHKVNDKAYPDIFDNQGVFNDDLFLKKFNMVMKLPIHMLASIGVNQMWFEMRVRKLYSASAVGNG